MLKVIVEQSQAIQDAISNRQGTSASGRPWQIRSQECWVFKPNSDFPEKFSINLPDNIPFYPAGEYQLDIEAMVVPNDFKSLSLGRGAVILKAAPPHSNAQKTTDDAIKKADFSKIGA